VDVKLELVLIPVSDVDGAKAFYTEKVGFHVDHDHSGWAHLHGNLDVDTRVGDEMRVVQMTPPGSACSIGIETGITGAAPGSVRGMHLIVSDILATHAELVERGLDVSEVRHLESGTWVPGPDPQRRDYQSFAYFSDPDGNTWILQERGRSEPGA
jgi:catechol 2,3-dioxygenase-like lactoylglutathione lyase family enzyme